MDDSLEIERIYREERGAFAECRLTFRPHQIIFKNIKTGKPSTVTADQIKCIEWQRMAINHGIRLILKNGALHRFDGLKESEYERIKRYVESNYKIDFNTRELSLKGFNWGSTEFDGEALSFNIEPESTAFEIPLNAVQDCTAQKNEVIFTFHHNDDAPVGMADMRLYMPTSSGDPEETIKAFVEKVLSRASVIKVTGQSVATFAELQCLTPRGRYDLKVFPTFIQLHGKTFDYKIPTSTVLRLFQLPHKDGRQVFFILSLDPPIVQGQTRYQFLQLLFYKEDEETITMDMDEKELKEKYDGSIQKKMTGSPISIFSTVMKSVVKRKVNMPDYENDTNSAISCSYKNNNGLLYPLERGFMYVHKPAIHVRFEEISCINFARSDGSTRSFDLEIETKAGSTHIFNSIEKEEYGKLYEFVSKKNLRIKNRNVNVKQPTAADIGDDMVDSDDEDFDPDAAESDESDESVKSEEESDDDDDDEDFAASEEDE